MARRVIRAYEPGAGNFEVYHGEDANPDPGAGKVVTYWQPEAFTWYGDNDRRCCSGKQAIVSIQQRGIVRLTVAAVRVLAVEEGTGLSIGVNKAFLAVRKEEAGFTWYFDKKSGAVNICSKPLVNAFKEEGWPVPCRIPLVYDEKNGMLVGRKPVVEEAAKAG